MKDQFHFYSKHSEQRTPTSNTDARRVQIRTNITETAVYGMKKSPKNMAPQNESNGPSQTSGGGPGSVSPLFQAPTPGPTTAQMIEGTLGFILVLIPYV